LVDILKVRDAADVEQVVQAALANEQPLEILGHGSKRSIGHALATNAVLDISALDAIVSYEPNELLLTVGAGAPLADVLSLIDSKNQHFAFEPMNPAKLLGTGHDAGTIGGMLATGFAGPRRVKDGGARDHLLGAHAVSGFGETFKTGGKVVKNVTGYDLCKLLCGSWGTLAVMTEVTLKVMPRPESQRTLVLRGLDDVAAVRAMTAALGSPYDVSGAAHLPAAVLRDADSRLTEIADGKALTLLRLEGIAASVKHRAGSLTAALATYGAADVVDDDVSVGLWPLVRDVTPFAADGAFGERPVWRIVCPPASGGKLGQGLAGDTGGDVLYDWGGGLIWAALPADSDAHAALVRGRAEAAGGHATLVRAPETLGGTIDVFHPPQSGVAALTQRVKHSFDPKNILNRGRMTRGTTP
jgi:glycolate oxidase FAD binding subunit